MAKDKTTGLSDKQLLFCQEYMKDLNGTQAAIRAGYSVNTAQEIASQNLSKLMVQKKIQELKEKRCEKLEISARRVLDELAKIGFSDLGDYLNDDYTLKPLNDIKEKRGAIASIQIDEIENDFGKNRTIKYKLWDKLKALEQIARHIGFFEKDNEQQKQSVVSSLTPEQVKALNTKIDGEY